jgi:hypothetical protein
MIRWFELGFLIEIIIIAKIHAIRFAKNKPISPLFHFEWAAIYFIPPILLAWHLHSWWLIGAAALLRFVAYNPILNTIRKKELFYLHVGDNGSLWDEFEMHWAETYVWIWSICLLGFIGYQFIHV